MPKTAHDAVTRALRLIGVIDPGEAGSASEISTGLEALNVMLDSWAGDGVGFTHTTMTGSDNLTVEDDEIEAVEYSLAVALAAEYGAAIPAQIAFKAERGFERFLATRITVEEVSMPTELTRLPSQLNDGISDL